jgi:hypothetical protein
LEELFFLLLQIGTLDNKFYFLKVHRSLQISS